MYYTTGFRRDEIQDLAALVHEQDQRNATGLRRPWPPILGLFWSVVITLAYLRGNRVQWELAETYGVSQSTVSRAIAGVTPLLAQALRSVVPTAEELRADRQYIIDGTLLPCWSWTAVPGLWSGKHRTTGVVVQVAATLEGQLSWISDPTPGSRHDLHCLDQSGALDHLATYPP
ncbi:transposase family protein, partial [Pseudonocardia sp. ICBG601]